MFILTDIICNYEKKNSRNAQEKQQETAVNEVSFYLIDT